MTPTTTTTTRLIDLDRVEPRRLSEDDLAAWRRDRGDHVVQRRGAWWERIRPGLYQPMHVLARLTPDQLGRPTAGTVAWRAALAPEAAHLATGSVPSRLLRDVDGYDEAGLNGKIRNRLRQCRRLVEVGVVPYDLLLEQGHPLAASAGERIGFPVPDEATWARTMQAYLAGGRATVVGGLVDGQLAGWMSTYLVDRIAYMDTMAVHTAALPTSIVIGMVFGYVQVLRQVGDVDEVMYGIDRHENETLGRFKDKMGFPREDVPSRVWSAPGVGPALRRLRPDAWERLVGTA